MAKQKKYDSGREKDRSVDIIEVREIKRSGSKRTFQCYFYDSSSDKKLEEASL